MLSWAEGDDSMNKPQDTSLHQRMHKDWLRDPEYRAEYDRARAEIAQVDALLRELDRLRADAQISKAELARRIGRNESSIRRLFTADQPRPELPLVISIAQAVGARIEVHPMDPPKRRKARRAPAPA
jgi:DNA-binding XRE family transcriptional regulator